MQRNEQDQTTMGQVWLCDFLLLGIKFAGHTCPSNMNRGFIFSVIGLLIIGCSVLAQPVSIDYNREIRPIFSENCFACHGFDPKKRKADLRLDIPGAQAVVPGDAMKSEVWQRITSEDVDEIMPPPESLKHLTGDEKKLIRLWIETGAEYQPHWSFITPQKTNLPKVKKTDWPRNPIDHFILSRLNEEALEPSPEADRRVLIRRVTLDLTGLPPTPEEVEAFLSDKEEGAWERLIDRLIHTRDYAERRAQDWLDLARYADTRGFADDKMREIWPYRDWVVRALESNMPFDQFTIEQLAGDMLPNPTDEQLLATAFHRNAPQAKGVTYPPEEYRLKGVTDRVNTTGKVWLGLTVECSECHDHKFDPVSHKDYYSLFAIFNNIEHSGINHGQGGPTMTYRYQPDDATTETNSTTLTEPAPGLLGSWDGPIVAGNDSRYNITKDLTITARIRTREPVADIAGKYDWRGKQRSFVFGIGGQSDQGSIPGHLYFWVSSQPDPFAGLTVYGSKRVNDGREHDVAVVFQSGKSVRLFVDGSEDKGATIAGNVPESIAVSDRRLAIGAGYNNSAKPNAFHFVGDLKAVRLYGRALFDKELGLSSVEVSSVAKLPVMRELDSPRDTFIHLRGNFLSPGAKVEPAVPSLFGLTEEAQPRNRLQLAKWLVNGKNPLVSRVVVNRFWQGYFGNGLVRTPDDFGAQGALPTHPELLDWLAAEFVESGWDMKHMHRLIVTSATYRQSNHLPPAMTQRDPKNLLLSYMPRVRLPAEQIRDQALSVSGLLQPFKGGQSVFPLQPVHYWEERDLPGKWIDSQGKDLYRKSMYTYWRRMALHPTMELLDAPSRAVCVVKRNSGNLPTQALVTLNDPIFVEAARKLAKRIIGSSNDPTDQLNLAFQLCLGRLPDQLEQDKFLAFIRERKTRYHGDLLAAWASVATILLNLDETITRP